MPPNAFALTYPFRKLTRVPPSKLPADFLKIIPAVKQEQLLLTARRHTRSLSWSAT
jgi:hypothetical protein